MRIGIICDGDGEYAPFLAAIAAQLLIDTYKVEAVINGINKKFEMRNKHE